MHMRDAPYEHSGNDGAMRRSQGRYWLPEAVFAATLFAIAAYIGISSLYLGNPLQAFYQQALVLVLFSVTAFFSRALRHHSWIKTARCMLVLGLISFMYSALATLAFDYVPWRADASLLALDTALGFGELHTDLAPALTQSVWVTELLSLSYAAFIPYLLISFYIHTITAKANTTQLFLNSVAIMYAFGFLGYLFVPAYGPVVHLADQVNLPIVGGFFHDVVTQSIDRAGGPHGAFPSIHMAGAMLFCLFDFRHGDRSRAWVYMPLVVLIAAATVVLRYHYVVDLVAGAMIATAAIFIAERWNKKGAAA